MHKSLLLICLLFTSIFSIHAQIFRYIDMEDGLSSRRAFSIRQDRQDYIWILTHKGVDRYDGRRFRFYPLLKNDTAVYCYPNQNVLRIDAGQTLWEIGEDGLAFRYNELKDSFQLAFDLKASYPETQNTPISATYLDRNGNIWFCTENKQYVFQTTSGTSCLLDNSIPEEIVSITQTEKDDTYFLASERYLFTAKVSGNELTNIQKEQVKGIDFFDYIYYHAPSGLLVINSPLERSVLYDPTDKSVTDLGNCLEEVNINRITPCPQNPNELLIASDGGGVLRLDISKKRITRFLEEDPNSRNKMNGNIIKDIFIDKSGRIWNVVYPIGITVYSDKYPAYEWIAHATGSENTLSHSCVNYIMEDEDGDVWFATNDGVSCYRTKEKKWATYCTSEKLPQYANHIFTSLCQTRSGNILAGGYMSGIYVIDKKNDKVTLYRQESKIKAGEAPDKYIRSILRDSDDIIWTGGFYSLKSYDTNSGRKQEYTAPYPITCISQRDANRLWVGTTNGLYSLDKKSDKLIPFSPTEDTGSINMMYSCEGKTFVGTNENGLFVIDNLTEQTIRYHSGNSGLRNNNIYSIVSGKEGNLMFGTENGICVYNIRNGKFINWTKEQGLMTANFNPAAAIHTKSGHVIFGSNEGFIVLPDSMQLPASFKNRMVLSNLNIMYRTVHPQEKNSPLIKTLDETQRIDLKYNQNTFSLNVSSINYDTQESIFYSWKLEGFYNEWSAPTQSGLIRYTNLSPGNYCLKIRAIFFDNQKVVEERELQIVVGRPFRLTFWAFLIYAAILAAAVFALVKYLNFRHERKVSEDKINFFTQAAHDIRTPLTLIKAPLNEIAQKERLSEKNMENLKMAIYGTEALSELADNLVNFQKEELYTSDINVTETELNQYLSNYVHQFDSYARQKGITLNYESSFDELPVWIDVHKINSILHNLLSNAFKYTPQGGNITVKAETGKNTWTVTVSDTGIGIPKDDQKKLFKDLFRSHNAARISKSGSGIGLILTCKLIEKHGGKITFDSTEHVGTSFRLTFPVKSKRYRRRTAMQDVRQTEAAVPASSGRNADSQPADAPYILVVEDNELLRNFIMQNLSDTYRTEGAANGKEGIDKAKAQQPNLIVSDIMMPVMDGREMCRTLKSDMETSHIPVILLTALGGNDQILLGLETKADQYLTKPFDMDILKATIHNLLENRRLMRQRFQQAVTALPADEEKIELPSSLDDEFMKRVVETIKENLGKELNVDILCSAMNMSRTSFYNKIKELTGIAPAEFIRNIRMQEAALLLKSCRYTVAEVSDRMGFADPKYFTDTFKKFYGIPPSVYMKQQEQKQDY